MGSSFTVAAPATALVFARLAAPLCPPSANRQSKFSPSIFPAIPADEATGLPWQSFRSPQAVLQTLDRADRAYLPQLTQALAQAQSRSGLQPASAITVRIYPSTPVFRNATLAPGWVAAFTEGSLISTQPLRTLASRRLLTPVLRHELLHALVESHAAPRTPLWLREGLVEAWSQSPSDPAPNSATDRVSNAAPLTLDQINTALAHAANEAQPEAAHRAAAFYADRLLAQFGRTQVLSWLRTGLPPNAIAAIR